MSYLILARKYRPMTFEDVVAQEHVTRTLRNAIKHDRVGSSYLFCGPRGTGKTTVARILAKAINCAEGPTETPCGTCPACVEITSGSSLDVLEIDAASNTGVDDIRTLRENVRYLPTHGRKRIYIIDEVHRLSGSAFDALLKTLEEPPPHVIFIFATTEPLKIPDTILSRTQRFDFRRVSIDELAAHLKEVAGREKLRVEETALRMLARKADGSVRDSLSLMDQIASFAEDRITDKDVITALGLVDRTFLFGFVNAIAETDAGKVLQLTRQLFDAGIDVVDFVAELLEHLRSLLLLATDRNTADMLGLPDDEVAELVEQAGQFSVGDLLRLIKIVSELHGDFKSGLNQQLLVEVAAVRMAELEATVRLEDILAQLQEAGDAPSSQEDSGGDPDMFAGTGQKKKDTPEKPILSRAAAAPAGVPLPPRRVNLAQLKAEWEHFLTVLRSENSMLSSQLSMAELRSLTDNELLLVFPGSAQASLELAAKPENRRIIDRVLRTHFRSHLQLRFAADPNKVHPVDRREGKHKLKLDPKKIVENSPRLQRILELVEGEIVGVKEVK